MSNVFWLLRCGELLFRSASLTVADGVLKYETQTLWQRQPKAEIQIPLDSITEIRLRRLERYIGLSFYFQTWPVYGVEVMQGFHAIPLHSLYFLCRKKARQFCRRLNAARKEKRPFFRRTRADYVWFLCLVALPMVWILLNWIPTFRK